MTTKLAFEATGIVLGHIGCCNGYRGRRDQLGCCDRLHDLLVKHPYILAATGVC